MNKFWSIECLVCGIGSQLLTDNYGRIICEEHHTEAGFKKVDSEIHTDNIEPFEDSRTRKYLRSTGDTKQISKCDIKEEFNEITKGDNK